MKECLALRSTDTATLAVGINIFSLFFWLSMRCFEKVFGFFLVKDFVGTFCVEIPVANFTLAGDVLVCWQLQDVSFHRWIFIWRSIDEVTCQPCSYSNFLPEPSPLNKNEVFPLENPPWRQTRKRSLPKCGVTFFCAHYKRSSSHTHYQSEDFKPPL